MVRRVQTSRQAAAPMPIAPAARSAAINELPVDERNIEQAEKETIDRANKALSALEIAIASWESAREKPEYLRDKFDRYKKLHDALAEWERRMLKSIGMPDTFDSRVQRLHDFVNICYSYS